MIVPPTNSSLSELAWRKWPAPPPDLNGPVTVAFDPPGPELAERPMISSIMRIVGQQSDALALSDGSCSLTYRALGDRVMRLAGRLATDVRPGAAVVILADTGVSSIVAQLACAAAGVVSLVPNMSNPPSRLAVMVEHSGAAACIAGPGAPAGTLGLSAIPLEADAPVALRQAPRGVDEPAFVFYTSGSTGQPKGMVRSQRQTLARARGKILQLHLHRGDRLLSLFNCAFTPGLMSWQIALLTGATMYPMDITRVGANAVLEHIRRERVTILMGTPSVIRMLLELATPKVVTTVRAIFMTGEPILRSDVTSWRRVLPDNCAIAAGYAMTEVTPIGEWYVPEVLPPCGARLPAGYPDPAHDYALADEAGATAAEGEAGVLWLRGRFISLGEWQDGQCVPGRLLRDPANEYSMVLCTGDLVHVRPDGLLEVIGRADRQVKVRGNRVDPAEVEEVLRQVDGVADASVVPEQTGNDIRLVAYAVVTAGVDAGLLQATLRARVLEALPSSMHPARIVLMDSLPRLPSGKIDRNALASLDPAVGSAKA